MRISIDDPIEQDNAANAQQAGYLDLEDDLYDEFWDVDEQKAISKQSPAMEEYEVSEEVDQESAQDHHFQIGFDLNLAKIVVVLGIFMLMFGVPVALLNGAFDLDKYRDNPVYTQQAADQKAQRDLIQAEIDAQNNKSGSGKVAGISTDSLTKQTNQIGGQNFMGVPVTTLFILIGLLFIMFPLVYAVR